jgi:hypothetical protein
MRWSDPVWVRWQIEHQIMGDPSAYAVWMMKRLTVIIKVDVIPATEAFSRAMKSTAEAMKRFNTAYQLAEA